MKDLRSQYDQAAAQLAASHYQQNATRLLGILSESVQAFQAEGFAMSMDVRPDKQGNASPYCEQSGHRIYANGEVTAEGQKLQFILIGNPSSGGGSAMWLRLYQGNDMVMQRASTYDSAKRQWTDTRTQEDERGDEYGEDPVRLRDVTPVADTIATTLIGVLTRAAAATRHNVAADANGKSFKVPSTIKLGKGNTP